jgi:hypothetical protein
MTQAWVSLTRVIEPYDYIKSNSDTFTNFGESLKPIMGHFERFLKLYQPI